MLEYLSSILRPLVDHPSDIQLATLDGAKTFAVEVRCHKDDIRRVIGRNGRTIQSIRQLFSAVATRQGRRALVEVVE